MILLIIVTILIILLIPALLSTAIICYVLHESRPAHINKKNTVYALLGLAIYFSLLIYCIYLCEDK